MASPDRQRGSVRPPDEIGGTTGVSTGTPTEATRVDLAPARVNRRRALGCFGVGGLILMGGWGLTNVMTRVVLPQPPDRPINRENSVGTTLSAVTFVLGVGDPEYFKASLASYAQFANQEAPSVDAVQRFRLFKDVMLDIYMGDDQGLQELGQLVVNQYGDEGLPDNLRSVYQPDPYGRDGECEDPLWWARAVLPEGTKQECYDAITQAHRSAMPIYKDQLIEDRNLILQMIEKRKELNVSVTEQQAVAVFIAHLKERDLDQQQVKDLERALHKIR